jgi:hypothetical protein
VRQTDKTLHPLHCFESTTLLDIKLMNEQSFAHQYVSPVFWTSTSSCDPESAQYWSLRILWRYYLVVENPYANSSYHHGNQYLVMLRPSRTRKRCRQPFLSPYPGLVNITFVAYESPRSATKDHVTPRPRYHTSEGLDRHARTKWKVRPLHCARIQSTSCLVQYIE